MAKLSIQAPDQPERIVLLSGSRMVIGRLESCEIPVMDKSLSRQHCALERTVEGYRLVDLGSINGTHLNGTRIPSPQPLLTGDLIQIGETRILFVADSPADCEDDMIDAGQTIQIEASAGEEPSRPEAVYALQYCKGEAKRILRLTTESVTIGRHPSCSIVFNDASVSNCHARIDRHGEHYRVSDLGSTNGVRVNGRKVSQATLRPGTRIRVGKITLGFKEVIRHPASAAPGGSTTPPTLNTSENQP